MDLFVTFVVAPAIVAVLLAPLLIGIIKYVHRGNGPPDSGH
jgi:hypothetical protein